MKWILKGIGVLALMALAVYLFGYGTMWLWNYTMVDLFHLPALDFYHAIALFILAKILFGGFRGRGHWGRGRYWKAKWEGMTPEERETFKARFAEKCRHKWGRVEVKVEKTE
jgi:hypothetical protein